MSAGSDTLLFSGMLLEPGEKFKLPKNKSLAGPWMKPALEQEKAERMEGAKAGKWET
jgi:hypothetical protein